MQINLKIAARHLLKPLNCIIVVSKYRVVRFSFFKIYKLPTGKETSIAYLLRFNLFLLIKIKLTVIRIKLALVSFKLTVNKIKLAPVSMVWCFREYHAWQYWQKIFFYCIIYYLKFINGSKHTLFLLIAV